MKTTHELVSIGWFTARTTDFEQGVPVRETHAEPYARWYCSCGEVSGRKPTRALAEAAHRRHQLDAS